MGPIHDSHVLVLIHIFGGCLGIITGFLALSLRKGSRNHRRVGTVFTATMMIMAAVAAYMAFRGTEVKGPNIGNVFGGILTFYLVGTAWLTARRKDGRGGRLDAAAMLIPVTVGVVITWLGVGVAQLPGAVKEGVPAVAYFFMGIIALLCAVGDLRFLIWGIAGAQRIARHLWRMTFGLWIAASSFFIGQPQVFPRWMHQSHILFLPSLLILVLLCYWLIRVLAGKQYKKRKPPPPAAGQLPDTGA